MPVTQAECRNLLLRSMSPEDFALLGPGLEPATLPEETVIAAAGTSLGAISFIEEGIASFAEASGSSSSTGIGIVGYEGIAEWHTLLGSDVSPHQVSVAVGDCTILRIHADALLTACRQSPSLYAMLMHFVRSFVIQLAQTAVSNLTDPVERRLCRWLLMNHDRIAADEINLTHSQIGTMLGVRRASVTDALHVLEGDGLIRSQRRRLIVRDRGRLRVCAGENYGVAEAEYSRLIAPFGRDRWATP